MKRSGSILSVILILTAGACLDPISFDIWTAVLDTIVINGSITSDPGPYKVTINIAFDLNSKEGERNPVSAKRVIISDNTGISEELNESSNGIYLTNENGIHGTVGRIYTLTVELPDGRVYESIPDTLIEAGNIESVYAIFREGIAANNASTYGFDVMFQPVANAEKNYRMMWKFTGTYQSDTNPELAKKEGCGVSTCQGCNKCNYKPLCSGIRNMSPVPGIDRAVFVRVGPCECCTCWYNFFNPEPILSKGQFLDQGKFAPQRAMYIPLEAWVFQHKVHAKVSQFTLSRQAFDFWTAVKDQKTAVNSLFQPVTGKIKGNIVQKSGPSVAVDGLFFAAGVSSKAMFIEREDVPGIIPIPEPGVTFDDSCLKLAPYATTQKPDFWD